jgi:hypothetical protein
MPATEPSCIHVYTSDQDAALAFVRVLAENLSQPVQVHPLSELATAPVPRPTRPQLRAERAALVPALSGLNENIRLAEDAPTHLREYLPELYLLRRRYEARLTQIEHLLTDPPPPVAAGLPPAAR